MLIKALQVCSLGLAVVLLAPPAEALADACSQAARISGDCGSVTTEVSGGSVTIGASATTPGTAGSPGSSTPPAPPAPAPLLQRVITPALAPVLGSRQCLSMLQGRCRASSPARGAVAPPAPARAVVPPRPPAPPTRVSDLAQFSPQASSFVIEPNGWSLPRVPTNVYSTAAAHQVSGVLLGWPMEVRFIPVRFHWSFGDGATARYSQPGSSWGADQFSPTLSAHVYAQPGTYQLSLVVDYDVGFRWQGQSAFTPVSGSISQSAGSRTLEVLRVTPVLVERGCAVGSLVNGRCEAQHRVG